MNGEEGGVLDKERQLKVQTLLQAFDKVYTAFEPHVLAVTMSLSAMAMILVLYRCSTLTRENNQLKAMHGQYGLGIPYQKPSIMEKCYDVMRDKYRMGERDSNREETCSKRDHIREHALFVIENLYEKALEKYNKRNIKY